MVALKKTDFQEKSDLNLELVHEFRGHSDNWGAVFFVPLESFKQIKLDRDLERVRQRYMQSTKAELVNHLIRLEQYVAQQNQIWLKNEFEKYQ
ncbi:hypothetical protein [Paenibacillus sp. Soil522]|uniref:hypothetical protein n=1 Tax=Paenibacillus sp. Soil522 TaxID=1736388 RepID=UPI0006F91628|nr:hypothetical protein [Paenibacillus sp. Soil522]KRE39666.1 hypothetical protein ASG81_19435 [Paenibacillus sp. Soil522]